MKYKIILLISSFLPLFGYGADLEIDIFNQIDENLGYIHTKLAYSSSLTSYILTGTEYYQELQNSKALNTFTGLREGSYHLKVVNSEGCTIRLPFEINICKTSGNIVICNSPNSDTREDGFFLIGKHDDQFNLVKEKLQLISDPSESHTPDLAKIGLKTVQLIASFENGLQVENSVGSQMIFPEDDADDVMLVIKFNKHNEIEWSYYLDYQPLELRKQQNNHIKIYPNPSFDILTIESKENILDAKLYSVSGSSIFIDQNTSNTYKTSINLMSLASGVYFCKITTLSGTYTRKIFKAE